MSRDHSVYVKTQQRTLKQVFAVAQECARDFGVTCEREEFIDEDENEEILVGSLGVLTVKLHRFGVKLSVPSGTSVKRLVAFMEDVGAALGETLDADDVKSLIAKEQADGWSPAKESQQAQQAKAPLPEVGKRFAGTVTIELVDAAGVRLAEASTTATMFQRQLLPGGMLKASPATPKMPELLTDQGRFPHRARQLLCTCKLAQGGGKVRFCYQLDGYGRVISVEEEAL
jgi:hypothetical protein